MFRLLQKNVKLKKQVTFTTKWISRNFLSQAYFCQEVWDARLNNPILKKVNLEELYQELDQRFQKTRQMSAVDVDIFTNALSNNIYVDEMLDLVHKLRLSADSGNMLNSTSHAVITLLTYYGNKKDLLSVLDDRINYGVFLDFHTANILMNKFLKERDFTSGTRIASQLMLQEDFDHPISLNLTLLHCYNYLLDPKEWPSPSLPEEPEDEVKVRVNYVRNPFNDDHFDLKDPQKIVGKTLALFTNKKQDAFNKSFNILGWLLYNKQDKAEQSLKQCCDGKITLFKEILDMIPKDCKIPFNQNELNCESIDVNKVIKDNVEKATQEMSEKDIAKQCATFALWEEERTAALEKQKQRLLIAKRLAHIEDLKKALEEKERKLWFFDNEEKIELQIEERNEERQSKVKVMKKTKEDPDQNYIPPEI